MPRVVPSPIRKLAETRVIRLIRELNQKKILKREYKTQGFPLLFCREYDKAEGTTRSQTILLPSFSKEKLEKGITLELLKEHTEREVDGVMSTLFKNHDERRWRR